MELRQQTPQPLRTLAGVFTMGVVLLVWWFAHAGSRGGGADHLAGRAAQPGGGGQELPARCGTSGP